jgi:penicillin-insensitive murein DD-endopeptidase
MLRGLSFLSLLMLLLQANAQDTSAFTLENYYRQNTHELPSQSIGSVSNGALKQGHLLPYAGANFYYFDSLSYVSGRAFAHDKVKKTILETYAIMETERPGRWFGLMECFNQHGGELYPHRTHQNGLSVDFMMPLLKNGEPYYELDRLGADHYWMEFNDKGQYQVDTAVCVDFDLVAQHILLLNEKAAIHGLRVAKVIIKIEFKDELFQSGHGQQLANSGIYVVKKLDPLVNSLHDDHYHIDFELIAG